MNDRLPNLDMREPGFSTRSETVRAAREQAWCARTPFGLAVLRHRQAGRILRDRRLRQGSYAWPQTCGLTGTFADFWRRSLIGLEGRRHKALRKIAQAALSNDYVLSLGSAFEGDASALLESNRGADELEFMSAFSEPFAGRAVTRLLGLDQSWSADIARDAGTLGLAMGLDAQSHQIAINAAHDRLAELSRGLIDRALRGEDRNSLVARLIAEADYSGGVTTQTLVDLLVISIFGGVDTTRAQLGFAMVLFAQHPDQWSWLGNNPGNVPQAIEEVVRTRPTTTWSTREAIEDFEMDGVSVKAGETVHILVHATASDPLVTDYRGFDIRAQRKIHFGFGGGAHHCLGQFVARTDMACALRCLLREWRRIELADTPQFLPDSGNTAPVHLPLRVVWHRRR